MLQRARPNTFEWGTESLPVDNKEYMMNTEYTIPDHHLWSNHRHLWPYFLKLNFRIVINRFLKRNPQKADQAKNLKSQFKHFQFLATELGGYVYRAGYIAGLHDRGIRNPYDEDPLSRVGAGGYYSPYDYKKEINSVLGALWRWGHDSGKAKSDEIRGGI